MPHVNFVRDMPYHARDLYNLVMDVERYPDVFEDIKSVTVRKTGEETRSVDLTVSLPFSAFSYSCKVIGTPYSKIDIEATPGAFKSMRAAWNFAALPDGSTKVSYDMNFDFGGLGFKNAAALAFIQSSVKQTIAALERYAAKNMTKMNPQTPGTGPAP